MFIRLFFILFVYLFWGTAVFSQSKPVLDMAALEGWTGVGKDEDVRISADGKYFSYSIVQGDWPMRRLRTIVRGTTGNWKQELDGGEPGYFSSDSKWYVLAMKDQLCFVPLGAGEKHYEEGDGLKSPKKLNPSWVVYKLKGPTPIVVLKHLVSNRELRYDSVGSYDFDRSGRWLLCKSQIANQELVVYDLQGCKEYRYSGVTDYTVSENGSVLVLQSKSSGGQLQLEWVVPGTVRQKVWQLKQSTYQITSVELDESGKQLLFTVDEKQGDKTNHSIWYYRPGMAIAEQKVFNGMAGTDGLLVIQGGFRGDYIYIQLQERELPKATASKAKVEVWSYKDKTIQSVQQASSGPRSYGAIIPIVGESKIIRLAYADEAAPVFANGIAVVNHNYTGERFWEKKQYLDSNWVVDLKEGKRKPLMIRGDMYALTTSPGGRYLVYYSPETRHYYSYDVQTGREVNISASRPAYQFARGKELHTDSSFKFMPVGLVGWLADDAGLLVYDDYDIWQLDLTGVKPAECITNGYGRRHSRSLWLSDEQWSNLRILKTGDELLLGCYDKKSRYNGFFRQVLGKKGDPQELFMGPYCLDHSSPSSVVGGDDFDKGMIPVKAADARVWIVKRQSAQEAPNYFVTRDFKQYRALSDLQYHHRYNWLKAELVSFMQMDGKQSEGILYRPEDFDPSKKYPVIINYYINFTNRLYQYPHPLFMTGANLNDNLAWYVSRGYLVFTPDIYSRHGRDRYGCLYAVEGAGRYLSGLPYVDSSRMGILGHSIGGAHTMFLITHTNMFAAAFAGAAPTVDWVSYALSQSNTKDRHDVLEGTEITIGSTIWTDRDRWSNDNPVMRADKVTMPLLIYHGEKDAIPLSQPMEMYLALRRLDKPVWLLNYNESSHGAYRPADVRDLTLRASQFFDYYLKGTAPPRWMTEGIPARLKQIESRLELDSSGKKP